jgi:predicted phage terminase large subunit-like protein
VQLQDGEEAAREFLKHRCASDKELFAEMFCPHYCTREFNQFHRDLFGASHFGERRLRRVDAAPRGSAKSTFITLIEPIHDICYGLEKYILIISNTGPLAAAKLKDIRSEILSNFELQAAFGVRFPGRSPGETQFVVESNCGSVAFTAVGRGSQVRGARFGAYRPTKVICDDVEHSDEVHNERIRQKTHDWFFEDVVKVGDVDTSIKVVGTILHKQSLLSDLRANPAFSGKTYQSIISWSERQGLWDEWTKIYINIDNENRLADSQAFYDANKSDMLKGTKVLWPEKEDYLALMKEMLEIGRRAFFKEKQNEPQGASDMIFERVHWYRDRGDWIEIEETGMKVPKNTLGEARAVLDPSTGQTKPKQGKLGDFSCLLTGYQDMKGRILVHHDWTKRVAPTQFINAIFEHHEKFKYEKFGVETNLYRNLLLPNILEEQKRRNQKGAGVNIKFYDIEQTENKIERIFRLEPKVNHGLILFNRALSETFRQQLEDFPHADHDDCPDALEMLHSIFKKQYKAAGYNVNPMIGK